MNTMVNLPAWVLYAWGAGYVALGWLIYKATKP